MSPCGSSTVTQKVANPSTFLRLSGSKSSSLSAVVNQLQDKSPLSKLCVFCEINTKQGQPNTCVQEKGHIFINKTVFNLTDFLFVLVNSKIAIKSYVIKQSHLYIVSMFCFIVYF